MSDDLTYEELLDIAVEFAEAQMDKGTDWYTATETANEEFGVSLRDIQARVVNPLTVKTP